MEDTESSDFLSSSDSLCSSFNSGSASNEQGDPNHVGYDVFLSDALAKPANTKEFESVKMIPNSRLSSADHPVLIRLENEYQARRAIWHRYTGQYCRYTQEMAEMTACQKKHNLLREESPLANAYPERPLLDLGFPDGSNLEAPQGLKRQRNPDPKSPSNWSMGSKEPGLPVSDGDRVFAQKCQELHGFIKPLTELLNGLKRGRYDRGLSSFQQSLAMDRIQRIVGVLQKPEMGERYLSTLLQVEMMLKVWFPEVTSSSSSSSSELDMEEPQSKMAKFPEVGSVEPQSRFIRPQQCLSKATMMSRVSQPPAMASIPGNCVCCQDGAEVLAGWPAMNLAWMHTSPMGNAPVSQADLQNLRNAFGQDLFGPNGSSCGIMFLVQNSPVSSTPTTVPVGHEERPLDKTAEQSLPRSISAPPIIVISDGPHSGKMKNHLHSLPYLSARILTSVGENT